jgi:hypothetical protein
MHREREDVMTRRSKKELSLKAQRLVQGLHNAASVKEAGLAAGYGTHQAVYRAMKRIRRVAPEILEEIGYGQVKAIQDLREMADAKKTEFFAHQGVIMSQVTVEDNATRLKARIELNKMHGHYPSAGANGDGGGSQTGGTTIHLELGDGAKEAEIAAVIAARRGGNRQLSVGPQVDKDRG